MPLQFPWFVYILFPWKRFLSLAKIRVLERFLALFFVKNKKTRRVLHFGGLGTILGVSEMLREQYFDPPLQALLSKRKKLEANKSVLKISWLFVSLLLLFCANLFLRWEVSLRRILRDGQKQNLKENHRGRSQKPSSILYHWRHVENLNNHLVKPLEIVTLHCQLQTDLKRQDVPVLNLRSRPQLENLEHIWIVVPKMEVVVLVRAEFLRAKVHTSTTRTRGKHCC